MLSKDKKNPLALMKAMELMKIRFALSLLFFWTLNCSASLWQSLVGQIIDLSTWPTLVLANTWTEAAPDATDMGPNA